MTSRTSILRIWSLFGSLIISWVWWPCLPIPLYNLKILSGVMLRGCGYVPCMLMTHPVYSTTVNCRIRARSYHNWATECGEWTQQRDQVIVNMRANCALDVCLNVTQITEMPKQIFEQVIKFCFSKQKLVGAVSITIIFWNFRYIVYIRASVHS